MSGVYELGEPIILSGVFTRKDVDPEVPFDPDAVVVTMVKPDGTTEDATASLSTDPPDTEGDWEATFTADQSGLWTSHVEGTGSLTAIGTHVVYVRPGVLPEAGS